MPYLLWADLDEVSPLSVPLRPTVAWESSPHRYAALWYLDEILTDEQLNRSWTHLIGADKGGWDLTQVLRVPGTHNHKYPSKPLVKLMWDDPGIVYKEADIAAKLPNQVKKKSPDQDVKSLFFKYKKYLSPWARRELLNGRPQKGKRSEVFWKLTNELIEAGADEDEAFRILWMSPWNKFYDRRDGEDQLRREINKVFENKLDGPDPVSDFKKESSIEREEAVERSSDIRNTLMGAVENEVVDWIQYPYFARGHITTIEGQPEVGKSWLCMAAGAAISEGKTEFPQDGWVEKTQKGLVFYFDAENMSGNVALRMQDSGMLTKVTNPDDSAPFFHIPPEVFSPSLGDPLCLEEFITFVDEVREVWKNNKGYRDDIAMIVFDTLINYSGVTDTNKQGDVIQVMNNLKELAVHFNCSVVAIRHHSKASRDKDPMHRGIGSAQFGNSARIVIGVYKHPDDDYTRIATLGKNSLAHTASIRALSYSLERVFPGSTDIAKRDRTRMVWNGYVDITDADLTLSFKEREERQSEVKKDKEILADMMNELEDRFRTNGHPAKIPLSEIRIKANQTNIPEVSNWSRALAPLGYVCEGRGKNVYYTRVTPR
jgi:hypothetical protein